MPLFYITTMRHSINLMDKYPENHGQMDTQPTKYCQEEFNSTCKTFYIKCNFIKRFTFLYTISFVVWQCPVGGIAPLSVPWWPPVAALTTWTSQVRPWPCSPLLSVSGVQMVEVTPTTGYQLVHCQMSSDERLPRPAHWMVGAGYKKICGAPLTGEQDMARVRMRAWKTLTRSGRLDCPGCQGGGALLVGHILEGVTLSHYYTRPDTVR